MSFQMRCPKCQSTTVSVETQRTHFNSWSGPPNHAQLHCYTCGKIVFGRDAIEAEAQKQHSNWLAEEKDAELERARVAAEERRQAAEERRERVALRVEKQRKATSILAAQTVKARAHAPKFRVPGPNSISMSCSLGSCSTVLWLTPEQKLRVRATTKRAFCCDEHEVEWNTSIRQTGGQCCWKDCSQPSMSKSLYCSRDCSNKNARWRHGLRKEAEVKRREADQAA